MLDINTIIWIVGFVTILVGITLAVCKIHDVIVDAFYARKVREAEKHANGSIAIIPSRPGHWMPHE